jgi:hypothetical protein
MNAGIKLGDEVRDKITRFEGTVVAITEWMFGYVRVGVQGREFKDGRPQEPYWIDADGVEKVEPTPMYSGPIPQTDKKEKKKPELQTASPQLTGGPQPDPQSNRPGE